jgi:uncharacterized protein YraI
MLSDIRRNSIALFETFQTSAGCPSDKDWNKVKMSMEHWWNDTERGKQKYGETNLSNFRFFHRKSHEDCAGTT